MGCNCNCNCNGNIGGQSSFTNFNHLQRSSSSCQCKRCRQKRCPVPIPPCPPCPPDTTCDIRPCSVDGLCGGLLSCSDSPTGVTRTVGPGQTFTTIQAAVNVSNSGDQILVLPGIYPEQVIIPASKPNLFLRSQTPQAAIITPPPVLVGSMSIVETNATCTHISDFTISGPAPAPNTLDNGILVQNNGSAVITNNLIRDIRDNPVLGIDDFLNGINVDSGAARIIGNIIINYQKTGIRVNGVGTCSTILNNTITGLGPINTIAQNGIQISRGATATVEGNTITGNVFTGPIFSSAGILLFTDTPTPPDVRVPVVPICIQFNTLSINDLGLALANTTGALVQGNNSSNNIQVGVFTQFDSIGNVFIQNTALGNPIDFQDDSVGILSAGTGNVYLCNVCNISSPSEICGSTSVAATTNLRSFSSTGASKEVSPL